MISKKKLIEEATGKQGLGSDIYLCMYNLVGFITKLLRLLWWRDEWMEVLGSRKSLEGKTRTDDKM